MPYWLPSVALSLAIIYLWGGTPFWVANGWLTGGWALVLYAVLVAVPLIVLGVMAFRQRLGNTPPPPTTAGVASGQLLARVVAGLVVNRHFCRLGKLRF